jgi:hypothetical protein
MNETLPQSRSTSTYAGNYNLIRYLFGTISIDNVFTKASQLK